MKNDTKLHRPKTYYQSIPKVDLHRHLEGSLRLRTLIEIGQEHGLSLPNTNQLRELVQIGAEEAFTFENFLSKFQTLRLFYRSPGVIERVTKEAIADAATDNVRYLELRFTPIALGRAEGFPLSDVIDWVIASARQASKTYDIKTNLIASVNRHEGPEVAEKVAQLAADRIGNGIVGLDLAGNEAEFSGLPYAGIFNEARQAGLRITVHAGEWGPAQNVREAITELGAERIGHGVRVLEDPSITALARERQSTFEVCVTSNYQSGVIPALSVHPLPRMLSLGLNATINTDDPSISQITLSDEYQLVSENLNIPVSDLKNRAIAAAEAAFLPAGEKSALVETLKNDFPPD